MGGSQKSEEGWMNKDQGEDLDSVWKRIGGAVTPGHVYKAIEDRSGKAPVDIHVETVIWRGKSIPKDAIMLGPIFYVGDSSYIGTPWRPQASFFRLVKSCLEVFPEYGAHAIYIRSYQLLDYDVSEKTMRDVCVESGAPFLLTQRTSTSKESIVNYIHTASFDRQFPYTCVLEADVQPKNAKEWAELSAEEVVKYGTHVKAKKGTKSYKKAVFFLNGTETDVAKVVEMLEKGADAELPEAKCGPGKVHSGPEPGHAPNPTRLPSTDDFLERVRKAGSNQQFLVELDVLLKKFEQQLV